MRMGKAAVEAAGNKQPPIGGIDMRKAAEEFRMKEWRLRGRILAST